MERRIAIKYWLYVLCFEIMRGPFMRNAIHAFPLQSNSFFSKLRSVITYSAVDDCIKSNRISRNCSEHRSAMRYRVNTWTSADWKVIKIVESSYFVGKFRRFFLFGMLRTSRVFCSPLSSLELKLRNCTSVERKGKNWNYFYISELVSFYLWPLVLWKGELISGGKK